MYWQIDAGCYFLGIITFTYLLLQPESNHYLLIATLLWVWIYPLLLDPFYNFIANSFGKFTTVVVNTNFRIVYHPKYNMHLWGIEKYHSFDASKFKKIYDKIEVKINDISRETNQINRSFLLQKMSKGYLLKLCYGFYVLRILELPFWFIPSWIIRWRILDPMLLATEGSIVAACIAKNNGWAINLSGGFHHASFDRGGGFCIYPDISLTVHYLQSRMGIKKIMIIDLDAHQGNGYQRDFVLEENIYIVDCYNYRIYPNDSQCKDAIVKNLPIQKSTTDLEYLRLIDSIESDFQFFKPEFVIYNAGTDVLNQDPLGSLKMMPETVIERDQKVFSMCKNHGAPLIMLLSGGYHEKCAQVISRSIENILLKFD